MLLCYRVLQIILWNSAAKLYTSTAKNEAFPSARSNSVAKFQIHKQEALKLIGIYELFYSGAAVLNFIATILEDRFKGFQILTCTTTGNTVQFMNF